MVVDDAREQPLQLLVGRLQEAVVELVALEIHGVEALDLRQAAQVGHQRPVLVDELRVLDERVLLRQELVHSRRRLAVNQEAVAVHCTAHYDTGAVFDSIRNSDQSDRKTERNRKD